MNTIFKSDLRLNGHGEIEVVISPESNKVIDKKYTMEWLHGKPVYSVWKLEEGIDNKFFLARTTGYGPVDKIREPNILQNWCRVKPDTKKEDLKRSLKKEKEIMAIRHDIRRVYNAHKSVLEIKILYKKYLISVRKGTDTNKKLDSILLSMRKIVDNKISKWRLKAIEAMAKSKEISTTDFRAMWVKHGQSTIKGLAYMVAKKFNITYDMIENIISDINLKVLLLDRSTMDKWLKSDNRFVTYLRFPAMDIARGYTSKTSAIPIAEEDLLREIDKQYESSMDYAGSKAAMQEALQYMDEGDRETITNFIARDCKVPKRYGNYGQSKIEIALKRLQRKMEQLDNGFEMFV